MNSNLRSIPIETLRSILRLDEAAGKLYWIKREASVFGGDKATAELTAKKWNSRFAGKEALYSKDKGGYCRGAVLSKDIKAHRVIYALVHGEWPESDIDHINGDRSDNRPENLRSVSRSENMKNSALRITSSTGYLGVSFNKGCGNYRAHIQADGRLLHLGYFDTADDARKARISADKKHGYHKNHGRSAA